nr:hypothetical protein [Sphingomonas sp. CDS-1]
MAGKINRQNPVAVCKSLSLKNPIFGVPAEAMEQQQRRSSAFLRIVQAAAIMDEIRHRHL